MAAWQYDFHVLPSAAALKRYGAVPIQISEADFATMNWWVDCQPPAALEHELVKLLPRLESWRADLDQWGFEDGNRVDVSTQAGLVSEIFVRIDVRALSAVFLADLLRIARRNAWLFRTTRGRVFPPSLTRLLDAIHASDAFRFVEDPDAFLETLAKARERELEERGDSGGVE